MRICQSKELKDFQNELNLRFRLCCYNGICRFAPTGEEYLMFSCIPKVTKREAIDTYKAKIEEYCKQYKATDTLYWRKYPELRTQHGRYGIYSRLLISNFPIEDELVQGKKLMKEVL